MLPPPYDPHSRYKANAHAVDISGLDHILHVDEERMVVSVRGLGGHGQGLIDGGTP